MYRMAAADWLVLVRSIWFIRPYPNTVDEKTGRTRQKMAAAADWLVPGCLTWLVRPYPNTVEEITGRTRSRLAEEASKKQRRRWLFSLDCLTWVLHQSSHKVNVIPYDSYAKNYKFLFCSRGLFADCLSCRCEQHDDSGCSPFDGM